MKELLGIICATVSIVSAGVALYALSKCSETKEDTKKKNEPEKDDVPSEFDCTCCDDCYGCCEDIDMDDIDDIEIDNEVPTAKDVEDVEEIIPEVEVATEEGKPEEESATATDGEETKE